MNLFILAGETSGESHAAELINQVRHYQPSLSVTGIGGDKMRAAGAELIQDCRGIDVVGIYEALKVIPTLYGTYKRIQRLFQEQPPDLVILVDYPGFNLKIARLAKRYRIPVLYYISPQVWAWRSQRLRKMKRYIDQMAVILPFETKIYQQAGIPVQFVGNPSVEAIQPHMSVEQARSYFQLPDNKRIIAIIPGSRRSEIKRMLNIYLQSASQLQARHSDLHFIVLLAPGSDAELIRSYTSAYPQLSVQLIEGHRFDALRTAHAAIVTSGTATLETALLGIPLILAYKVSLITYWIGRLVVQIRQIGLCNLVAEQEVAPELIQWQARPEPIYHYIHRLLTDSDYYQAKKHQLQNLQAQLPSVSTNQTIGPLVIETAQQHAVDSLQNSQ